MTERCPACHSPRTVPVIYGMPDLDMAQAAERGEVVLAGCALGPGPAHPYACRTCDHQFATDALDQDPDRGTLNATLPVSWHQLPLRRPTPGTSHLDPLGHLHVRNYDTGRSAPEHHFDDEEWILSVDRMKHATGIRIGDTVLYLGETHGHDHVTVWDPARILWLGAPAPNGERWALSLMAHGEAKPLQDLTDATRQAIRSAAQSLSPIPDSHRDAVLTEVTTPASG